MSWSGCLKDQPCLPFVGPEMDRVFALPGRSGTVVAGHLYGASRKPINWVIGPLLALQSLLRRPFPLCMRRAGRRCWESRAHCTACPVPSAPARDLPGLYRPGSRRSTPGKDGSDYPVRRRKLVDGLGLYQRMTYSVIASLLARILAERAAGRDSSAARRLVRCSTA